MNPENTSLSIVKEYLKRHKIGTLDQLKKELSSYLQVAP